MSLSARVLTIAFSLFILLAFPVVSFAQSNYASQPTLADARQESYKIQRVLAGFGQVIICQLSGRDVFRPGYDCAGQKVGKTQSSRQQSNGILGMALGGIVTMYQPPLTTLDSLRYFAGNFGIVKPILAQEEDLGSFQSFSFLQNMHITIRNISYMLLVILFIFIGIAIMLRFKIDPRTVMSIQNQIPKIIIGVVMITFSYAIAGLLVDGMWVLTYFGINTIGNVAQVECGNYSNGNDISGVATKNLLNNPMAFTRDMFSDAGCFGSWDGLSGLAKDVGSSMGVAVSSTILESIGLNSGSAKDCDSSWHNPDVKDCIQAGIYSFMAFLIGIVATIIVLIAIILALVRLWFTLIKAYVYILLDVVTAPIQILIGIFPGGKMGFVRWLRHISAYLLIFPASATLIVLAIAFALNKNLNQHATDPTATFYPPLIGIPGLSGNMGALIAFGLIMIMPELLEMIKDALQVKNSDRATKAVSGGFSRGLAPTAALGGFGKELFGKDKNGNPKIGSLLAGGAYKKYAGPGTKIGENRLVSLGRRRVQDFRAKQMDLRQEQGGYINEEANRIKTSELVRMQNQKLISNPEHAEKVAEFRKREFLIRKGRLNRDANKTLRAELRNIAQAHRDYKLDADEFADPEETQGHTPTPSPTPSAGSASPSTPSPAAAPRPTQPPAPTSSTTPHTVLKQASWHINELKEGNNTILTRNQSQTLFYEPGSPTPMTKDQADRWIASKGYTIV